jgi:hypothetical protein
VQEYRARKEKDEDEERVYRENMRLVEGRRRARQGHASGAERMRKMR